ncbi:NAC domain-containing protein 30-like [Phoenix dactylifera]|uniref:NAC domain-containing protein 30-like n=1 Tax=Phoenix dactylifera TaxID=42345 RepID=A0A8B8J0M8_PHODC|nr:NAC domain-containing protein 30-like [Phoenix dactylifera]XP_038974178.1 NAC domain-containing protein 30-like [Phoenix dactylifera]XP_038978122.1 NAC domain-containing protein 30-like [Phoenix dactylifera]
MLPPGYLFRPTDEVLLIAYLKNKLLQWPLPCDVIVEGDVYGSRPQDLALEYPMANKDYEWFFFTSNPRKHSGASETSRASRRAGLGRWKATKGIKKVLDSKNNTIGSKQSFCYMEQNWDGGEDKSIWLMEEFSMQNLEGRGSAGVIRDTNKVHIILNITLNVLVSVSFLIVGMDVLTLHLWSFPCSWMTGSSARFT